MECDNYLYYLSRLKIQEEIKTNPLGFISFIYLFVYLENPGIMLSWLNNLFLF